VESSCESGNEPLYSIKCWESSGYATGDLSGSAQLHTVNCVYNIKISQTYFIPDTAFLLQELKNLQWLTVNL
jgi:hypothetical protein